MLASVRVLVNNILSKATFEKKLQVKNVKKSKKKKVYR